MKKHSNIIAWSALLLCVVAGGFYYSSKNRTNYGSAYASLLSVDLYYYFREQKTSALDAALLERFAKEYAYETAPSLNAARLDVSVLVQRDNRVLVISRVTQPHSYRLIGENRDKVGIIREDEAKELLAKGHALQIWMYKKEWPL